MEPELDMVVWTPAGERASQISKRSEKMFKIAASHNLHLATMKYPTKLLKASRNYVTMDQDYITCLRSCLMKPEHRDWLDRIWQILDMVADRIVRK